jgi:hypothetical protein
METNFAPIALFAYSRPQHTKNALDSLFQNEEAKESELYIFCDGAKANCTEETLSNIAKVREVAQSENRFKKVTVVIQEQNKGLANSIISGVTQVVNQHGSVIVLEDDLIVSKYFLGFMNDGLVRYKNDPTVAEIGGCNFFACGDKFPDYFVSPMAETLGWATWKERWDMFSSDSVSLYKELEKNNLMHKFNTYGAYDMQGMLKDQIFGKVDSWAIRWQAVMVLNGMYCLHSNPSHVNHIESFGATHAPVNIIPPLVTEKPVFKSITIAEDANVIAALKRGYAGQGDYYGNYTSKYIKKRAGKIVKTILLFPIPYGLVTLFKKNKKRN